MSKTKAEILQAQTAHEVHLWIQSHPNELDAAVGTHFNKLAKKEFEAQHPNYDPDIHYEGF